MNPKNKPAKYLMLTTFSIFAMCAPSGCAPKSEGDTVNKEDLRQKIEEIYNKGRMDTIDELFDPDYISYTNLGEGIKGTGGVKQYLISIRTAFPDLKVTIDDIMVEGNKVALRRTFRGTNTGPIKFPGLNYPPTGRKITWTDMGFLHFKDGRITKTYQIIDSLGLMQQLGLILQAKQSRD